MANELVRVLQGVVHARGLPIDYMHHHGQLFSDGFRTWITSRWLESVVLEIYDPSTDTAVQRIDLGLEYDTSAQGGSERFETLMPKIEAELANLPPLSLACRYRIVVHLAQGAPSLPGWAPTNLRDVSHLRTHNIGKVIDTSRIGVDMAFLI